ncbi:MAG: alpha-amylase/4-alpha-glucanotransferase domain-containing protein [Planctomycetota bacterium]
MNSSLRLCLVLHNHQPIGNFSHVIEQAYRDSYLPFLDVFEPYEHLRIVLHTSGPLMYWLVEHHPEYLERLHSLVAKKRIELIGGPMYEPILTMLPSRDRIGQIKKYRNWLQSRFECSIDGMWMPERVWESQLTRDIVPAGIQYTLLDDHHFLAAGWNESQLTNYYLTEDDGNVLRVFPSSEPLRYLIPFAPPAATIEYCQSVARRSPGGTLFFGDDGEMFGTWPNTHEHCYERGWLRQFFDLLTQNRDWLRTTTLADAINEAPPAGTVFLPDCSYREMTEWALPVERQIAYHSIVHELESDSRWPQIRQFIRAGNWRNFRVKYSEANEMYCRMLEVSRRLEFARRNHADKTLLAAIEDHLYRGQCNCPYWHGAFGGIYLPHLRNANYRELISADNLLERTNDRPAEWVDVTTEDYDKDLFPEIRLANDRMIAYFSPARGGMLYEWDLRDAKHNLLATIQRRPEEYHLKVRRGASEHGDSTASIHDRIVFKQAGLEQRLAYDAAPRKSLIDHFFDPGVRVEDIRDGRAVERGDFAVAPYDAKLKRTPKKIQLQFQHRGRVGDTPITLTKGVCLLAGSHTLELTYLLENIPRDKQFVFAMELNFAGLPGGAKDRFFYNESGAPWGHLGTTLNLESHDFLGLIDEWLGINIQWTSNRSSGLWCFPIETVSQSEGGFELVHQSVCVMPHWTVSGNSEGRWAVQMRLTAVQDRTVGSSASERAAFLAR